MSSLQRLVGTVLGGRYRIEKVIGEGGMGAIFEATQLSLSRRVAVKVVKPAFEHDEDRIKRFEVETEAIARLQHPHIVSVVDAGRGEDGTLFLAMELLEGVTVRQAMREGPIHWPRALTIAEGVASALVAAHNAGVIHRDLKAENVVLWSRAGRPDFAKVLDFGVAKLTSQVQAPAVTGTGFVAGTPGCISPEQILGKSDDPRSDLYSLGVMLFEMLTGMPPFPSKNPMELMLQHLHEQAPRPSDVMRAAGRELPAAVDALVVGLLQKDPGLRPPNAQALVDALRSMRESFAATASEVMSPVPTPPSQRAPTTTPEPFGTPFGSKVLAAPTVLDALPSPGATAVPSTSPTTTHPLSAPMLSAPAVAVPSRRRKLVAAGIVALLAVGVAGAFKYSAYSSSASSMNKLAAAHIARAEEAYWELDLRRVMDETDLALQLDPGAAWAHVLRSQVTLLDYGSLARADAEMGAAMAAADRRREESMMFQTTHLQDIVRTLATLDAEEATKRFAAHVREFSCDESLERQMFAVKQQVTDTNPVTLKALYDAVRAEDSEVLPPATAIGLARAARLGGDTKEARRLLEAQLTRTKSSIVVEEFVDLELSEGRREQAQKLLDDLFVRDRGNWRVQLRLAALDDSTDGYNALIAELRRLRPQDPRRVDGLITTGLQLASQGRLNEGSVLWEDAFAGSTIDNPDRAAEIAAFSVFFMVLHDDYVRGNLWHQRVKDWAARCSNEITAARIKMFALAGAFLLSRQGKAGAAPSEVDYAILYKSKRDAPLVMQQVEFSRAFWTGKLDEAEAHAKAMPPCFQANNLGLVERARAGQATDPEAARTALVRAAEHFDANTRPQSIASCAAGTNVVPWLQAITVGMSYAQRALVAQRLGDRDGARSAIAGFRAYWPRADADGVNARDIASVEAWLNATPATTPAPR